MISKNFLLTVPGEVLAGQAKIDRGDHKTLNGSDSLLLALALIPCC